MVLRLGQLTHAVDESERFAEVAELERSLEGAVELVPALHGGHIRSMPSLPSSSDERDL